MREEDFKVSSELANNAFNSSIKLTMKIAHKIINHFYIWISIIVAWLTVITIKVW